MKSMRVERGHSCPESWCVIVDSEVFGVYSKKKKAKKVEKRLRNFDRFLEILDRLEKKKKP